MRRPEGIVLILILLAAALLTGCPSSNEQPGVVAIVNDSPIFMEELESRYDLQHLSWASAQNPTVSRLRRDYGQILGDLIIQKLVEQALQKRDLSVSDEEVARVEAEVRADYPEGMFEQVLMEEYIDLDRWREQVRARLEHEKFLREVLRPTVKLDYQEAEAYYNEHEEEFHLPARVHFLLFSGPGREMVSKAVQQYLSSQDLGELKKSYDKLTIQDLRMREDRLPVKWQQELQEMEPGEVGEVTKSEANYQALLLKERIPSQVLPPTHAYPFVERMLLEQKIQKAFQEWLDKDLAVARIYVTALLVKDGNATEEIEEPIEDQAQALEPGELEQPMDEGFMNSNGQLDETAPDNADMEQSQ